jgi:polyphosphate glucokinase
LGSALFLDGKLLPNTEFGHVRMHGMIAEHYASSRIRKELNLDWEEWGKRFDEYLNYMDLLVNPDQIFLGGGISKHFDLFSPFLNVKTKLKPAKLRNNAGIIGAACFAHLD